MEQNRALKQTHKNTVYWSVKRHKRQLNAEKIIIYTKGTGTTGQPQAKKRTKTQTSWLSQKLTWNGSQTLDITCKLRKLMGENIWENLCDLEFSGGFIDKTLKARSMRKKLMGDIN